jgi:transposase
VTDTFVGVDVTKSEIVVANPRQVRDFAKATGQLAKTDDLDADMLALFAERVRPTRLTISILESLATLHDDSFLARRRSRFPRRTLYELLDPQCASSLR